MSDVPSDLTIKINNVTYLLHKVKFYKQYFAVFTSQYMFDSLVPSYSILFFPNVAYYNAFTPIPMIP